MPERKVCVGSFVVRREGRGGERVIGDGTMVFAPRENVALPGSHPQYRSGRGLRSQDTNCLFFPSHTSILHAETMIRAYHPP